MMKTEARKRQNTEWKKANAVRVSIRLYKNTDADLLAFLDTVDNKQGLIKRLLREEMNRAK